MGQENNLLPLGRLLEAPYKSLTMPFPLDPKFVQEAEQELGLVFPFLYKQKMIASNGGVISTYDYDWLIFPIYDRVSVRQMNRTRHHVVSETYIARTWPGFPLLAVAIAENGYGDYLVLLPTEPDMSELRENVFLWIHESVRLLEIADSVLELW